MEHLGSPNAVRCDAYLWRTTTRSVGIQVDRRPAMAGTNGSRPMVGSKSGPRRSRAPGRAPGNCTRPRCHPRSRERGRGATPRSRDAANRFADKRTYPHTLETAALGRPLLSQGRPRARASRRLDPSNPGRCSNRPSAGPRRSSSRCCLPPGRQPGSCGRPPRHRAGPSTSAPLRPPDHGSGTVSSRLPQCRACARRSKARRRPERLAARPAILVLLPRWSAPAVPLTARLWTASGHSLA